MLTSSFERIGAYPRCQLLFDPSHFVLQQLNSLDYIDIYKDFIRTLRQLPPATILSCEYDPLRDEAEHYALRLREDGGTVRCERKETEPSPKGEGLLISARQR